jgi:putative lipoprotein
MNGLAPRRRKAISVACAVALLCAAMPSRSAHAQATSQPASIPSPDPDPWFGPDKALHFGAGFGIGVGGYVAGAGLLDNRWAGLGLGLGLAALIGGVKEGIDAAGAGQPSWKDFVWDVVGGALGVGVSLSFDAALRGTETD